MDIDDNRKKSRIGMKHGEDKSEDEKGNSLIFNFSSLIPLLQAYKGRLLEQSIFGDIDNNQELDETGRILELIKNNKIKINGKFKVERSTTKAGNISSKIHWQSVYSIGKEIEAATGKQRQNSWAANVLQEAIIKNLAEKQGLLISDEERKRWGEAFDDGSEADVYNDPDDEAKVLKTVEYLAQNNSLSEFFERTMGFNVLFPKTRYDMAGFIEDSVRENLYDRNKMLKPVLRQPYVYGKIIARLPNPQKEFQGFFQQFQDLGYVVDFVNRTILKEGYEASDLNAENVMKMPDGQYYVIDAWVRKIGEHNKDDEADI